MTATATLMTPHKASARSLGESFVLHHDSTVARLSRTGERTSWSRDLVHHHQGSAAATAVTRPKITRTEKQKGDADGVGDDEKDREASFTVVVHPTIPMLRWAVLLNSVPPVFYDRAFDVSQYAPKRRGSEPRSDERPHRAMFQWSYLAPIQGLLLSLLLSYRYRYDDNQPHCRRGCEEQKALCGPGERGLREKDYEETAESTDYDSAEVDCQECCCYPRHDVAMCVHFARSLVILSDYRRRGTPSTGEGAMVEVGSSFFVTIPKENNTALKMSEGVYRYGCTSRYNEEWMRTTAFNERQFRSQEEL